MWSTKDGAVNSVSEQFLDHPTSTTDVSNACSGLQLEAEIPPSALEPMPTNQRRA